MKNLTIRDIPFLVFLALVTATFLAVFWFAFFPTGLYDLGMGVK